jgi:hypothetical protein
MRKRTSVFLALIPVAALCAGAGVFQPERDGAPGGGGQPAFDPARMIDRMFERDADGDGKLSREEMGEGPRARIFDAADANEDGFLERAEVEKFMADRRNFQRPGDGRGPGASGAGGANFQQSMEQAGRALRRLRRSDFTAETQAADLEQIAAIEQALLGAKSQYMTAELSDEDHAEFKGDEAKLRLALRTHLAKGLATALEAELAVLAGDADGAAAAMTKLQELRDQGHDRFQPAEDDNG